LQFKAKFGAFASNLDLKFAKNRVKTINANSIVGAIKSLKRDLTQVADATFGVSASVPNYAIA